MELSPLNELPIEGISPNRKQPTWRKILLGVSSCIFGFALLVFVIIFIIFPLIFMNSRTIQNKMMFQVHDVYPSNPQFNNSQQYGLDGVRNFYINVNDGVLLGVWQIIQENLVEQSKDENFDYIEALRKKDQYVIIYFHGTGGHRITPINTYKVLRKHFHVIAFDYRGYGDSSSLTPTEESIVNDSVGVYKWLRKQTEAKIFLWGHSLGTSLSTSTISKLRDLNIIPMGLFLEAPFTTMREELSGRNHPIGKIFSWLPWYEFTVLNPLYDNGFRFETITNIHKVDCPILILHAKDDQIIPYKLGVKLCEEARKKRNENTQGNVTLHLFPAHLNYKHLHISNSPDLPDIIQTHINVCLEYNLGRG